MEKSNEQKDGVSEVSSLIKENSTTSNSIEVPSISLPKGGGALKGIDEKFEVNASNGTATFTLPIPLTPGRNGFTPSLSLSYNSGSGNSPYGLGWALNYPSIKRKTDKRLPSYEDKDVFTFSGSEDLVPVLDNTNSQLEISEQDGFAIQQFRPRVEGSFARIERITHLQSGNEYWKVCTRDNIATYFGLSENSRISNPNNETKIYAWLPQFSYDQKGNWIRYRYKEENLDNVSESLSESHRQIGLESFTNKYLKQVSYGNHVAWYPDSAYSPTLPDIDAEVLFDVIMDYGEHLDDSETTQYHEIEQWESRPDAFSSYRSGFDIRTNRLCNRILMFHHFEEERQFVGTPDETNFGREYLVKSLDLNYDPSTINESGQTEVSYLQSIVQSGYIRRNDGTYSRKSLPPIEFDYQHLQWNQTVKTVDAESTTHSPIGLTGNYQWVDLYSEGISGIFTEQAEGWYYKNNLGVPEEDGQVKFSEGIPILSKPSLNGINDSISVQDLEANGKKQIVADRSGIHGYYELDSDNQWIPFQELGERANINIQDPNTRVLDLTGDGKPDILITEENAMVWYASKGKKGYDAAKHCFKSLDEEKGPSLIFKNVDRQEAIFLTDMTGDGLTDILRVRNGEICYWANKGYGQFSAKITMDNAPLFDYADIFNVDYLQLADVSGTGATDIIYLGKEIFKAYLNLSGNGWSDAHEIDPFFELDNHNKVSVIDLLGTGTSCIVWSSGMPSEEHAPLRYIDLMDSKKPHVLTHYSNNLGKETSLEYKSSTHYYLKDKQEGTPWITKLPFPVQVISKQIVEEKITHVRFTSEYHYHHGYYDHAEREFRGFGRVEQLDTETYENWQANHSDTQLEQSEELYQSPTLTKTWFHTGAFLENEKILTQFEQEYWYEKFNELFPDAAINITEPSLEEAQLIIAPNIPNAQELLSSLDADEWREAVRACKGMVLRQEIFALDGNHDEQDSMQLQAKPYSVATHNCQIQLLQRRGPNAHAVLMPLESEAITIHYERNELDPRINHSLNIRFDELGNILENAIVVYPRQQVNAELPPEIQEKQEQTLITYTHNAFTNDVISPENYRLRQVFEASTYEITNLSASDELYQLTDFDDILAGGSTEIGYHEIPNGSTQRRRIEHLRILFHGDDLIDSLPLGVMESQGIVYESYQLAYTPELLEDIFADKIVDSNALMTEGRYVELDGNWWIRSGTVQFLEEGESLSDAQQRFYSPFSYTDPFGSMTTVSYYQDYFLLMESTIDAIGNEVRVEQFNFRTLSPIRTRDINDNISAGILDELGLVKAIAFFGKGDEADDLTGISEITDEDERTLIQQYFTLSTTEELRDAARELLQHASSRFVYDFERYRTSITLREEQLANDPSTLPCAIVKVLPTVTGSITREQHHVVNENSPLQLSFEYSDGAGNVAMVKVQREPGEALQLNLEPDCQFTLETVDTGDELRWLGNGRTVLNNKGNPVKQYEPYFSTVPFYEDAKELVERGVTPIIHYDAIGRAIRTELPDGTFTTVSFDAWQQTTYDANDTVMDSRWFEDRGSPDPNGPIPVNENERAAWKAAQHHDTPSVVHLDTLGRSVYSIAHNRVNGVDEFHATQINLDIEGNARSVIDARGNAVMLYQYDILGHRVYENSMDAGESWMLSNCMGNPLRSWDSRQHVLFASYDVLQRPTQLRIEGGDGEIPLNHVVERMEYGEGRPNELVNNLRGQLVTHYDTAGRIEHHSFDFKGNLLSSSRQFASDYKNTVDWSIPDPDSALEAETFTNEMNYDALNRIVESTSPDGSITAPTYNEAGLLGGVSANMQTTDGLGRTDETFVQGIRYDEKGRRQHILYGNNIRTNYTYDPLTYRLMQLETRRQTNELLQDLRYTYDPVGNITEIEDRAIPTVFFGNHQIEPRSEYTYDALYRLVEASGREHIAQNTVTPRDNWNDLSFMVQHQMNDPMAWRNYTQSYQYDSVGNILEMRHQAPVGNWTRTYTYEANTNRLINTQIGGQTFEYPHHEQHGFMVQMPHLSLMEWNFKDELRATARQVVNTGTPEITYYVYDSSGQRVRKVTENQASAGNTPTIREERLYLGSVEIYRNHSGNNAGLERQTLHISDDSGRIAMVDTRNEVNDDTEVRTMRYQLSNHLGSASLETNEVGAVISYEEYHPYGTTAYQAVSTDIRAAAKRYRYTGMERDEETGLGYHTARYYIPWLGRWSASDPIGIGDGVNVYGYVQGNPIEFTDPSGNSKYKRGQMMNAGEVVEFIDDSSVVESGNIPVLLPDKENYLVVPTNSIDVQHGKSSGTEGHFAWSFKDSDHGNHWRGVYFSTADELNRLQAIQNFAKRILFVNEALSKGGHFTLDMIGFVPGGIGMGADAINAFWYAAEGDVRNYVLSLTSILAGAIPSKPLAEGMVAMHSGSKVAAKGQAKAIRNKNYSEFDNFSKELNDHVKATSDSPEFVDRLKHAKEGDIAGYFDLTGRGRYGRTGDRLDSDEALQNVKLREEFGVSRTDSLIKDNPAMALSPSKHRKIRNLKAKDVANMSASQVLEHHLKQMHGLVPEFAIKELEKLGRQYIKNMGLK